MLAQQIPRAGVTRPLLLRENLEDRGSLGMLCFAQHRLWVCAVPNYGVFSRTSPLIEVSAEDNRTRLKFQLRTTGHVTLIGWARKWAGGCSVLHSSHWDRLEDLSQTSGHLFF